MSKIPDLASLTHEQKNEPNKQVIHPLRTCVCGTRLCTEAAKLTEERARCSISKHRANRRNADTICQERLARAFPLWECAFEDLGSWEVKKYTYEHLYDGTLDGRRCFIVKNTPAYESSRDAHGKSPDR